MSIPGTRDFHHGLLGRQRSKNRLRILIVDNGTSLDRGYLLRPQRWPLLDVSLLQPNKNLGYMDGAHYAFSEHCRNNNCPEWTLILNPDVEIADRFFIDKLSLLSLTGQAFVGDPLIIGVFAPEIVFWRLRSACFLAGRSRLS